MHKPMGALPIGHTDIINLPGINVEEENLDKFEHTIYNILPNDKSDFSIISKEEIAMVMDSTRPVDSIEDAKYKDNKTDKTISILEQISTGKDEQSEIVNKIAIKNLIGELEDNEKEIILLRYYKQKTQMQVSKILGITQVQVSRIERKVLEKMKRKLIS